MGNGVPTSQYGGTAVGGSKGAVVEDEWGLLTAFGTGARVAQVSNLVKAGAAPLQRDTNILFIVAMDTKKRNLAAYIDKTVARLGEQVPGVAFSVVNLVDHDIYRCLGCETCPKPSGDDANGRCYITDKDDYLEFVRARLAKADGFVICGYNPVSIDDLVTRYQVFTERMRFIRRNNYELSNKLVTALCYHEFGATINPIHSLKSMVSYIRHNTVMRKPIDIFEYEGTVLDSGLEPLVDFCHAATVLASGCETVELPQPHYDPYSAGGGYSRN